MNYEITTDSLLDMKNTLLEEDISIFDVFRSKTETDLAFVYLSYLGMFSANPDDPNLEEKEIIIPNEDAMKTAGEVLKSITVAKTRISKTDFEIMKTLPHIVTGVFSVCAVFGLRDFFDWLHHLL